MDNNLPHSSHYATISFDLEDPEAEKKLKRMLNVDDYISVLFNFKTDVLRKYFKYEEGNKVRFKPRGATEYKEIELDYDTVEYIEDIFYSLMAEYEINLDKLTY